MRFGLFTSMGAQTWSGVLDLWRHIEATGWDIGCVIPTTSCQHEGARGGHARSWSHAQRAGRLWCPASAWAPSCWQPPTATRRWSRRCRAGRHHLARPAPPGARRGLAARTSTRPTASVRDDARAGGASGRGVPGDEVLGSSAAATSRGASTSLRMLRSIPSTVQRPIPADDRRRREARHPAHRGQARDHWNNLGGPGVLARKGRSSTRIARPSAAIRAITRSANMVLLITDRKDEVERLAETNRPRASAATPPTRATPAWRALRTESATGSTSSRGRGGRAVHPEPVPSPGRAAPRPGIGLLPRSPGVPVGAPTAPWGRPTAPLSREPCSA